MNTVQLTAIMDRISANTHFLGVLACDQLPERPIQKLPLSVIINTHSSDLPGEHWLAVHITKDRIGCLFWKQTRPYNVFTNVFKNYVFKTTIFKQTGPRPYVNNVW